VRRTLSHSLHEIAQIVGTEITETALRETFELFLKDLDQVRISSHPREIFKIFNFKFL
jgi:serine/threonine-protein phosphatase 4 regulatory subunit 1